MSGGLCLMFCAVAAAADDMVATKEAAAGRMEMVRYGGTPREFGRRFGERHRDQLRSGQRKWLAARHASREKVLKLALPMVEVVRDIAPHWLEEAAAMAAAAGVDAGVFVAQLFVITPPDDCTTYVMTGPVTEGKGLFFHRTRDNRPGKQTGAIWDIDAPGINKLIDTWTRDVAAEHFALLNTLCPTRRARNRKDPSP